MTFKWTQEAFRV